MTKEEIKEYKKKYYQNNREKSKESSKKYYQENKERINSAKRKKRKEQNEKKNKIYKLYNTKIHIPSKYRHLYDECVDIVFLKNGVYIYKHNGKNEGNNIVVRNISNAPNCYITFYEKEMYKIYGYVPSKITYKPYKNGLLGIFVED